MSQLLWGTLSLGLLVLVGVGLYSWWDMRRARKKLIGTVPKAEKPRGEGITFMANRKEPGSDTTIMDTRIEPRLHDDDNPSARVAERSPEDTMEIPAYERLRGQSASDVTTTSTTTTTATTKPSDSTTLSTPSEKNGQNDTDDASIVSSAFIEYAQPVSGQALLQHLPGSRRAGSKPVEILANKGDDDVWEPLNAQHHYRAVRADVLLANRMGPLNEMDYSEFVAMMQRLAEATDGEVEFDDMQDAVKRARELDEFAAAHDALISLSLRAKAAPWSVGFLQQSASSLGFVPGQVPGRMVKLHASGDVLVSLQFDAQAAMAAADQAQPQALSLAVLVLDVPQAAQLHAPLAVLKDSATKLSEKLEAAITDEGGRVLTDDTWLMLSSQLSTLYSALEGRGLVAGSASARRVYS